MMLGLSLEVAADIFVLVLHSFQMVLEPDVQTLIDFQGEHHAVLCYFVVGASRSMTLLAAGVAGVLPIFFISHPLSSSVFT